MKNATLLSLLFLASGMNAQKYEYQVELDNNNEYSALVISQRLQILTHYNYMQYPYTQISNKVGTNVHVGYYYIWGGAATLGSDPTVLPVQLINFYASTIDYENHINWHTLTEANNDYFTIEKSTDGVNFRKLYEVIGAGNSSGLIEYSIVDNEVEAYTNFYRLSQTGFNGESKVIGLISVNNTTNRTLLKIANLIGHEVATNYKGITIEYYSDGSTEKVRR